MARNTLVEITPKGREKALNINSVSPAQSALSMLEMREQATVQELIQVMGVGEQEGLRILKAMKAQHLIKIAEEGG